MAVNDEVFGMQWEELNYWEKILILFFRKVKKYWKFEVCFFAGLVLGVII